MALHHGVPLVQAGTTEEKSEIAARIAWSGVGVKLGTTRPTPEAVGAAVRTVLAEGSPHRAAAERVAAEMRTHDAARESADLLERLATTGRPVLRADTPAPARAAAPAPVTGPGGWLRYRGPRRPRGGRRRWRPGGGGPSRGRGGR